MKMMKLVVFVVDLAFTAFVLFELCVCSLYFVACFAGFFMLFFFFVVRWCGVLAVELCILHTARMYANTRKKKHV